MAKYAKTLTGNFDALLHHLHTDIVGGSISAHYEDGWDVTQGQVRVATRVYERYSYIGGNRVSMSITLVGEGPYLRVSAITSGGSQAVFFKINTFGESAFLEKFIDSVERFAR